MVKTIPIRAQSTVELAVVTAAVVAALLAMQVYIKRGICGKLRGAADSIGDQYAPGKTTSNMRMEINSTTTTMSKLRRGSPDVMETQTIMKPGDDVTTRTGDERVDPLEAKLW